MERVFKPAPKRTTEELIPVKSVSEEYEYVRNHYDGYTTVSQYLVKDSLTNKNSDVLEIQNAEGDTKYLYFDISSFF
ncbi:MAG: hypothetical protein J6W27_02840 [Alphaproteobacteria bacterium]|nr:hypothetical protein [Alphaproteobacteria bacterium]